MTGIKVTPLAFESMGVRSMCTFVETRDLKVLIDPGVSVAPRFSLMPHPREYAERNRCRLAIREAAQKADIITISHYHYDHHTPNYVDTVYFGSSPEEAKAICAGKPLLVKDTRSHVNMSQRRRGWLFRKMSSKFVGRFDVADGKMVRLNETELKFSCPVPHGEHGSELGWVLMLTIANEGEKVMHSPDVQGPSSSETLEMILAEKPDLLIVGGQPLYLAGTKVSDATIEDGFRNLEKIVESIPITILDHHILRSQDWRQHARRVFEEAEKHRNQIVTAAEYAGRTETPLEAKRRDLYDKEPPSKEFTRWTKISEMERKKIAPPV